MFSISCLNFILLILLISQNIIVNYGQVLTTLDEVGEDTLIWCTISNEEQTKCENFAQSVQRDKLDFKYNYFTLKCKQGFDKEECMQLIDSEKAHVTTLDAGEVFIAGRYNSLVPIMQEVYEGGFKYYYSVAVMKRGSLPEVVSLNDLRNKKACFAGVGTLAGWVVPIHKLMKRGSIEIIDCNNHVKSAINFFGESCAINSLIDKNNPIGDNSHKLCSLCIGKIPGGKCTRADPYAGYEGAFRCLLEAGDIAFLKHTTVSEMLSQGNEFSSVSKDNFELLCEDGTRRSIDEYRSCHWGRVPSHALVTTSAISFELRERYQDFIHTCIRLYSHKDPRSMEYNISNVNYDSSNRNNDNRYDNRFNNENRFGSGREDRYGKSNNPYDNSPYDNNPYDNNPYDENRSKDPYETNATLFGKNSGFDTNSNGLFDNKTERPLFYEKFNLFESVPKYGNLHNLLFQDNTHIFESLLENQQTYANYLGPALDIILGIRDCPVNKMTLCVTSDPELEKCVKMRTALKAQLLKPEMVCFKTHSHISCMQHIRSGNVDVTVLDASDVYTAGLQFDLIPFISEMYNLGRPEYYVVAVAREEDPSTELTYLKGKYTCHGGINTAAGWVYPLAYLISNGWIRSYGCNSIRAAAEYFTKSCVPGSKSTEYNTDVPYDNMCDLCHGTSFRHCRRDASEDYYGHTGAFRCLVEGGGDVAFVKHTTVLENTGGKRREFWARDALNGDFELLCPDGTRAEINEYERCNLGKVKANAIVTRGGYAYNETEVNAFINLFIYAQQFYGRKDPDEFSFGMFHSVPPFSDLIFQDATQQLRVIDPANRYYSSYLGHDFMRARRIVDCHAGANTVAITKTIFSTFVMTLLAIFISNGYF